MKRIISIVLISSIIGGVMHLDELVKIPFMVNHYYEHKKSNAGISFFAFINNHYVLHKKAESEKDKKSDSQLPYKSNQSFHAHVVLVAFANKTIEVVSESKDFCFIPYTVTKAMSRPFDIWQPPKL